MSTAISPTSHKDLADKSLQDPKCLAHKFIDQLGAQQKLSKYPRNNPKPKYLLFIHTNTVFQHLQSPCELRSAPFAKLNRCAVHTNPLTFSLQLCRWGQPRLSAPFTAAVCTRLAPALGTSFVAPLETSLHQGIWLQVPISMKAEVLWTKDVCWQPCLLLILKVLTVAQGCAHSHEQESPALQPHARPQTWDTQFTTPISSTQQSANRSWGRPEERERSPECMEAWCRSMPGSFLCGICHPGWKHETEVRETFLYLQFLRIDYYTKNTIHHWPMHLVMSTCLTTRTQLPMVKK